MDREKTEAWLQRVKRDSALTESFLLTQTPDDSFGWGRILKNMWFPTGEEKPSGTGMLLVGPAGCGKHTAVHHMLRLLDRLPKEEAGDGSLEGSYTYVALEGEELLEAEQGFDGCAERLNALLDDCYDRRRGLFLVLEGTASLPWSRKLYRFLETQLAAYYLSRGGDSLSPGPKDRPAEAFWGEEDGALPPFFLVLMEEEEPALPALLRGRLQLCRMSRPNLLRRKRFLMNRDLGNLRVDLDELHPGQTLAELTEGLSYAQLEDLVNSLRALTADGIDAVALEEEDSLRREQAPEETLPELQRQVWQKAEGLMDALPELLARRVVAVPTQISRETEDRQDSERQPQREQSTPSDASPAQWSESDKEEYERREYDRLEKMPVKKLAEEYFRKEEQPERERLTVTN